ncbi:MAG: hypothetical protein KZQ97_22075 [Candidatus Thiodiazotropha sp. (ex Dulcina madagascariensis)]|nr:hypothetical protein [Candidatus Thiodiazotropha sp. (ex Dulcina madagascariensis)]
MDISNHVYIWVTSVDTLGDGVVLNGLVFDGEFGFGDDEVREYSGTLAALSSAERSVISAELSTIHIAGKGVLWSISTDKLPNAPFLLTSNLDLTGPVIRNITLSPTAEVSEIFQRNREDSYPVCSTHVVGILEHSNERDVLIGFTTGNEDLIGLEELGFSEWGIELGKVTIK